MYFFFFWQREFKGRERQECDVKGRLVTEGDFKNGVQFFKCAFKLQLMFVFFSRFGCLFGKCIQISRCWGDWSICFSIFFWGVFIQLFCLVFEYYCFYFFGRCFLTLMIFRFCFYFRGFVDFQIFLYVICQTFFFGFSVGIRNLLLFKLNQCFYCLFCIGSFSRVSVFFVKAFVIFRSRLSVIFWGFIFCGGVFLLVWYFC